MKGRYETVSSGEEFHKVVTELAIPPEFNPESVEITKLRVGECEKENNQR